MSRQPSVLCITYMGLLDPVGEAQSLPYLRGAAGTGHRVTLLSFEKPSKLRRMGRRQLAQRQCALASERIAWRWLRYHKHPSVPATLYDVVRGIVVGIWLAWRGHCRVIHARGTVAAVMGWVVARSLRRKLLFDVRGLMAEEYADGGLWKRSSWRFRTVNHLERRLLAAADGIVVLTERIQRELLRNGWGGRQLPPMTVIPCCADLSQFLPRERDSTLARQLDVSGAFVVLYAGALGTWYLLDEMLDWFAVFRQRQPRSRFVIVTQGDATMAHQAAAAKGLSSQVRITSAPLEHMPTYWSLADVAVSFIRPAFSKWASSPTKVGEALACGVPLVVNRGVGDLDALVAAHRCGVIVDEFSAEAYEASCEQLLALLADPEVRGRSRRAAEQTLALSEGVRRYQDVYERIAS